MNLNRRGRARPARQTTHTHAAKARNPRGKGAGNRPTRQGPNPKRWVWMRGPQPPRQTALSHAAKRDLRGKPPPSTRQGATRGKPPPPARQRRSTCAARSRRASPGRQRRATRAAKDLEDLPPTRGKARPARQRAGFLERVEHMLRHVASGEVDPSRLLAARRPGSSRAVPGPIAGRVGAHASPWHSTIRMEAPDRPGLLAALRPWSTSWPAAGSTSSWPASASTTGVPWTSSTSPTPA
jgi:hypothetical protein